MGRPKVPSQRKRSAAQRDHLARLQYANKENNPPTAQEVPKKPKRPAKQSPEEAVLTIGKKLANSQRQAQRLKTRVKDLCTRETHLNNALQSTKVALQHAETAARTANETVAAVTSNSKHSIQMLEQRLAESKSVHSRDLADIKNLKKRLKRADLVREQLARQAKKSKPTLFRLMSGRAYSPASRRIARLLVSSGCSRAKAGEVLNNIAGELGCPLKRTMSERTVSRAVLEGYVATQVQLGHEIGVSEGKISFNKDIQDISNLRLLSVNNKCRRYIKSRRQL